MTEPAGRIRTRIYHEDTDAGGIVYHTAYLRFAERGRTELLRSLGHDHHGLRFREGGGFVVRSMVIDYAAAARLDDEVEIETEVADVKGASLVMRQKVMHDGRTLVSMDVRLAFIGAGGRAMRLPAAIRETFNRYPGEGI
ncbi:MAG: YbgC/FadM family acyl-CoA thioesterase [Alphaproteobacteria bacterium]|nr:YbgC/FadM family acyl-CoA thioesterase [Alphaproteobacteria bacterium]